VTSISGTESGRHTTTRKANESRHQVKAWQQGLEKRKKGKNKKIKKEKKKKKGKRVFRSSPSCSKNDRQQGGILRWNRKNRARSGDEIKAIKRRTDWGGGETAGKGMVGGRGLGYGCLAERQGDTVTRGATEK